MARTCIEMSLLGDPEVIVSGEWEKHVVQGVYRNSMVRSSTDQLPYRSQTNQMIEYYNKTLFIGESSCSWEAFLLNSWSNHYYV